MITHSSHIYPTKYKYFFQQKKKKIYIYNKELVLKECASDEKINNNNLNYNCGTFIEIKFVLEKKKSNWYQTCDLYWKKFRVSVVPFL